MANKDEEPDFSGVKSGASSTAPSVEPTQTESSQTATSQTYTVVAGDSLSKISKKHYGDANHWRRIFEANRDLISDPDEIYPGQTLKIPSA